MTGTGVKRIYLLDYGLLAGEPGWFVQNPLLYVEMGDVNKIAEKHRWIEIPVMGALIEHRDGLILFDTGSHPEASKTWTQSTWQLFPMVRFTDENRLENQLRLAGAKPEDISFVVFSHMHLDHIGQAYIFKDLKTPLIVHKKELQNALYHYWLNRVGSYQPVDLEALRGANWFPIDVTRFELLPGVEIIWVGAHTPGSIMLRVATDDGNFYILTGDFVLLPEEIERENQGWLLEDLDEYISGMRLLRLMLKRPRTRAIISHDPELWSKYPKAPKYIS